MILEQFNRIEVTTEDGRQFIGWGDHPLTITLDIQDDGKTLKVFVEEA
jgi:hypothetical protein